MTEIVAIFCITAIVIITIGIIAKYIKENH